MRRPSGDNAVCFESLEKALANNPETYGHLDLVAYCWSKHTKLCDHKRPDGTTCDKPMCDKHTSPAGINIDYCRDHKVIAERAKAEGR